MAIRRLRKNNCFCAFCKTPRRVETRKHLSLATLGLAVLFSLSFSVMMWTSLDARALLICVLILGLAEFLIHIRWRLGIVCQHCGFDPVLYLKDPTAASQKVSFHLNRRAESPLGTMRKVNLPARQVKPNPDNKLIKPVTGKNLSKQV